MSRANDQISLQILDQSCLGLAAGEGPLGQDTEDVTDIVTTSDQVHGWIFMVTRQWQLVVSMSSYHVCAYCGDWRREQLVRIRSECWRGETLTLHQLYQVPQIRIYD